MTYCELALVLVIALLVLKPDELKDCAYLIAKAWRLVQSTKTQISAHLMQMDDKKDGPHG